MAEANRSRRPPYAANRARREHAPRNAGALSPARENHRPPRPASTVASRRGGGSYASVPPIAGRGVPYNNSEAPPARKPTTPHRGQITTTPGRIPPNRDASPGNRSERGAQPAR